MRDPLTEAIIGAAIEVHKHLGPGLLESIYEEALCYEFSLREIPFERQVEVDVIYKDLKSTQLKRALLINFGEKRLTDGIKRISL